MTKLSSIATNHLSIECRCRHTSLIPVSDLLEVYGDIEVDAVERALRCDRCNCRGTARVMIIYVGASSEAMQGSATQPKKTPEE